MRDPLKARTRAATLGLIRTGLLPVTPCRECGTLPVHAHHTSYDDPYAVVFLCARCHRAVHRRPRKAVVGRTVGIRKLDDVTWGFLRGEATRRRVTIAAMLRLIVTDWCDRRDDERRKAS